MCIHFPHDILQAMITYCAEQLPQEACGVLISSSSQPLVITAFIPLRNISLTPLNQFEVDPKQWIQVLYNYHNQKLQIAGFVHSHPSSAAIPSSFDLSGEWGTLPSHWIISFQHKKAPVVEAFRYHANGSYHNLPWKITNQA